MRKRQKTREERELAASLAEVSEKEAKRAKRSRRSKKSQPSTAELVERPLFMSPSLPAPPIPPLPTTLRPAPALVPTLAKKRLDDFDVNSIQNYQELMAALKAKKVQITLGNDIIATDNILINYDVAINFNGHSIISDESIPAARVLDIRSGEVTLTGRGKIFAMGNRSVALRVFGAISTEMPSYTTVTIDEGISLFSPSSHAIFIAANLGAAYGLKLNFSGEIIAHDGICLSADVRGQRPRNLPIITLKSGARIVVDENSGAALSALGYGIWEVGAVCLRGASGLRAKTGQIKCTHTQMVSNGPASMPTFLIEPNDSANLELAIEGGAYVSENSYIIDGDTSGLRKLSIKDSDFHGALGDYPDNIQTALDSFAKIAHYAEIATEVRPTPLPDLPTAPAPAAPSEVATSTSVTLGVTQPAMAILNTSAGSAPVAPVNAPVVASTPAQPASPAQPLPAPVPEIDEREAARTALAEALDELSKLRSSDYAAGFPAMRRAISQAKKVLRHDRASLTDIRDAASDLLAAFDNLEECEDMSLSDEELDELFYHGAVLEEMTSAYQKPAKKRGLFARKSPKKSKSSVVADESVSVPTPVTPKVTPAAPAVASTTIPAPASTPAPAPAPAPTAVPVPTPSVTPVSPAPVSAPIANPSLNETPPVALMQPAPARPVSAPQGVNAASVMPTAAPIAPPEPNLTMLSEVISAIARLEPQKYTAASYQSLLNMLTHAKGVIGRENVRQTEIDQVATQLLKGMTDLEPAPAVRQLSAFSSDSIDEMSPSAHWSAGVSAIDETVPFDYTNYRPPRVKSPKLRSPFGGIMKSITAGARAGFATYRRSRRATKVS